MGLIRKYETKDECVRLFVEESFNRFDSSLITQDFKYDDWFYKWMFYVPYDRVEDYDEDDPFYNRPGELTPSNVPMWNWWWEIEDSWMYDWIKKHEFEVAELGFTIIHHDDELWGLGIDGAGYDFYSAHWEPLYDLLGYKWHE